jgi:hypothetical protein
MEAANVGAKSSCKEHDLVAMAATLHAGHHFRMVGGSFFYPTGTFASKIKGEIHIGAMNHITPRMCVVL